MGEAVRILRVLAQHPGLELEWDEWDLGADRFLETGVTISDREFRSLADDYDAILLGALGDPRVPDNEHARDILLGLRFRLDLYVNYRPCLVRHPRHSPLRSPAGAAMDVRFFRENTEGSYAGVGGALRQGTPDEVAIQEDVNTYRGVERIIRAAFHYARSRGRRRVTMVDKANAMAAPGALWRRVFEEVAAEHAGIEARAMYVDAMAMDLVRRPDHHQVVVTSNLFGDILSDLGAVLAGGLGMAASANVHPGQHALFEPVHGSAPDIAGRGTANPMAAILCVALLLEHLGWTWAARSVEAAVEAALEDEVGTPDLGGEAGTVDVGRWIADHLTDDQALWERQTDE